MDRRLVILGSVMIAALLGFLVVHQKKEDRENVIAQVETAEQIRQETLEGYEEPEELIKYMLCQIQNGDMDLALRGCAIQSTSEVFQLQPYIEFTESYTPLEILPPTEGESKAYTDISQMRLAGYYAQWLDKCEEVLGPIHNLCLLEIKEDVPENPDGMYYQNRSSICEILGARKVYEALIYVKIDGEIKELRWTLVRHKKYWRVLLFNPLEKYTEEQPDIRNSNQIFEEEADLEFNTEDILPVNYVVLNRNSEDDPKELIQSFFLYLMRQDVMSAGSYMELYNRETKPRTSLELLGNHALLAEQLQGFYYKLFFNDQNKYEWYFRDLSSRAGNIVEDLQCDQIVALNIENIQVISEPSDVDMVYQVDYSYNWVGYSCKFILKNQGGWYIKAIEW